MWRRYLTVAVAAVALAAGAGATGFYSHSAANPTSETIYVVNHAGIYETDAQIIRDIPAWETALNRDFAPIWHTPQVKIELVKQAPRGSIVASFVKNGPVSGALAYHDVTNGVPGIVVYAGVADYYGYSNSVSFTHEAEEMLADPTISVTNQGYPYPQFCLDGGVCQGIVAGTIWAQEVSDPVEAYAYSVGGVPISDFITPNWFNDHVSGGYDFMGKLSEPLEIAKGGYAQYWDGSEWSAPTNFKHAGRDAAGYLKGERVESARS